MGRESHKCVVEDLPWLARKLSVGGVDPFRQPCDFRVPQDENDHPPWDENELTSSMTNGKVLSHEQAAAFERPWNTTGSVSTTIHASFRCFSQLQVRTAPAFWGRARKVRNVQPGSTTLAF